MSGNERRAHAVNLRAKSDRACMDSVGERGAVVRLTYIRPCVFFVSYRLCMGDSGGTDVGIDVVV